MTPEEHERQLQRFQDRFNAYMEQRRQDDQARTIGRTYNLEIDKTKGDIEGQYNEKIQDIDVDYDEDLKTLEGQNLRDHHDFKSWMNGQREEMRNEDSVQRVQTPQPTLTPSFAQVPTHGQDAMTTQRTPGYLGREGARNDVADTMNQKFDAYQEQEHDRRLDALNTRTDDNRAQLDAERQQVEVQEREKRDYFQPLPWETKAEAEESGQRALERAQRNEEEGQAIKRDDDKDWGR